MKRFIIAVFIALVMAAPAAASTIVWGPASLSEDNGGNFLVGATSSTNGGTASFSFPSYLTNGTFGFPSNQLNLGLSASISGASIIGVFFKYFGSFTDSASAQFVQTANAATPFVGAFSSNSFSGFIALAGLMYYRGRSRRAVNSVTGLD